MTSVPALTWSPSRTRASISTSGSSALKKASASGSPATTTSSRLSITPENIASAGITAAEVISPISPKSSAKVEATKASRSNLSRVNVIYFSERQSPEGRSEEHTSELQSLMRISYAVFCLKKKNTTHTDEQQTKVNNK